LSRLSTKILIGVIRKTDFDFLSSSDLDLGSKSLKSTRVVPELSPTIL